MEKTPKTLFWTGSVSIYVAYWCFAFLQTPTGPPLPVWALLISIGLWSGQLALLILRRRITLVIFLVWMAIQFLGGLAIVFMQPVTGRDLGSSYPGTLVYGLLVLLVILHLRSAGQLRQTDDLNRQAE